MLTITRYGFVWGPLSVERVASDEKRFGYLLLIKTAKQQLEIRVTPKGFIWVGEVEKASK